MPFHMLGAAWPARRRRSRRGRGGWRWHAAGWRGAGAGAVTVGDWRPIERPPPSGRAVASATIDSAVSAIIMLTKNFFMRLSSL